MRGFRTIFKIEGKIGLRNFDGILFGVLMPIGIALLIGCINGRESQLLNESFSAIITVGICATALMGIPLTLSDYRDKKILKHYFVTPVSPITLLITLVLINAITAIVSSVAVYISMVFAFGYHFSGNVIAFIGAYLLIMCAMYSMGMLIASVSKNVKMANVICTFVYFPMLFLSGATIPYEIMPTAIQKIMNVLPLTQGIKMLKAFSFGVKDFNYVLPICVMIGITVICTSLSIKFFKWE